MQVIPDEFLLFGIKIGVNYSNRVDVDLSCPGQSIVDKLREVILKTTPPCSVDTKAPVAVTDEQMQICG